MGRIKAILFGLAAVLLPVAAVLSHRNVPVPLALIALAGLPAFRHLRPAPWVLAAWGLIAWAGVTVFWSDYPRAFDWPPYLLVLAVLGTSAMLVSGPRAGRWLAIGAGVTLALLTIESLTGGLIRDLVPPEGRPDKDDVATARGITIMLCLVPGLMLTVAISRQRALAWLIAITFCTFVCAASFGIAANLMAALAPLAAAALVWLSPKWGLRLVLLGALLPFILMPVIAAALPPLDILTTLEEGPASWRMRLVAWKGVWGGITDGTFGFLFGHGVEGARVLGERLGQIQIPGALEPHHIVPTHPHNIYLQVWFDLGLAGVALAVASIVLGAKALEKAALPKAVAMAVAALIAMVIIFALTDASLWTQWRVAAPLLGAWLILAISREARREAAA